MNDDRLYLLHVQECIERVEQYTAAGRTAFFGDIKTQDAVLRNLQVMAESTQRLSAAIKATRDQGDSARHRLAGHRGVPQRAHARVSRRGFEPGGGDRRD